MEEMNNDTMPAAGEGDEKPMPMPGEEGQEEGDEEAAPAEGGEEAA